MRAQGNQGERIKKTQLPITATCNAVVLLTNLGLNTFYNVAKS